MPVMEKFTPTTVESALELLQEHKNRAVIMAGGTDLFIKIKKGLAVPSTIINISHINNLKTVEFDDIGNLYLGALATLRDIIENNAIRQNFKALHEAAQTLATPSIRTQATIGGNLCNAAPSADMAPILIAHQAKAIIADSNGQKEIPMEDFFVGPSQTVLNNALLTGIKVPRAECNSGSAYEKATRSQSVDMALTSVAACLTLDNNDRLAAVRLVLGAVAPTPLRAKKAEAVLLGQNPAPELFKKAAEAAVGEARPISDVRCKADYRNHLVNVLTVRALNKALARTQAVPEDSYDH